MIGWVLLEKEKIINETAKGAKNAKKKSLRGLWPRVAFGGINPALQQIRGL